MAAEPVTTSPLRVAIAGAGRVAVAVASLLQDRGHDVVSVWSRNPESTKRAARRLSAHTAPSVAAVAAGADLVLVGAVDDAIADVAADLAQCAPQLTGSVLQADTGWLLPGYSFVVDERFTRDPSQPVIAGASILLVASAAGG